MYSKETYEQAFALRKLGFTFKEISKKLNIPSHTTIYDWVGKGKLPHGKFLDPNYNKVSSELAYIFGVIQGDGYASISKTKGCIGLDVKDKDFALVFKDKLEKWSGLKSSFKFRREKGLYITRLYSLRATEFLKYFNIFNLSKASNKVRSNFLRGMFDSEGGVSGSNLKTPKTATRFIAVYNTNKQLILFVNDLIESLGIKVQNIDSRIKSGFTDYTLLFRLRIGGREYLQKFKEKIGFSIERKNRKLDEVLNSYIN